MPSSVGRVVLVTGGSAGIGRATVARLVADGAHVVTCARDADRLAEAVADTPGVLGVAADLTDADDRARLVEAVLERHGRLDAVVLNAGLGWAGLVEDMPAEAVDAVVGLNLTGTVDLTRRALPHLLAAAAGSGRADVVVVSSIAAWSQVPPLTVYSATKAGVLGFVRGLRREVSSRGVRVHSIHPAPVASEWLARGHGSPPRSDADARGRLSRGIRTERVAGAIAEVLGGPRARTISVPRWSGLARLGELPPVDRVLDAVLSRQHDRIRRITARVVERRIR